MTNEAIITLTEKGTTDVLPIPWTPKKIKFRSGGQTFVEYDIMDLGTIQEPVGRGIRSVRWDGILPGANHSNYPWQHGNWQDPKNFQGMFSMWKYNHTILTLIVSHSPICMDVYISDYEVTYQDGFGDYHYYIEFSDAESLSFTVTNTAETDVSDGTERETDPAPVTYTVKEYDSLFGIAECYLGDGLRWEEIYELNKDVIEEAAKQHGWANSNGGWWIFAGTVLKLP